MKILNKGFTLVELLVTISILATLIAILLPNFMGTRQKARDSKRIQDLQSMRNALRLYYNDNKIYPEGDGVADISADLIEYLFGIGEIEYEYYQTNNGDGFNLCVGLETSMGSADGESQVRCGVNPGVSGSVCGLNIGVTADKVYAVCAN